MEEKKRKKWTNKFRELGKKKGSRQDFIKLYKEMKKDKDKNKESLKTEVESWKDLVEENKNQNGFEKLLKKSN